MLIQTLNLYNGTISLECGGTIRTKRPRNRGFGLYHRTLQMDSESKILNFLHRYKKFGNWYNQRILHERTRIEMKTLRKTLDRLVNQERIDEYRGNRHSKLFCIHGTKDNIDYHSMIREFTIDHFLTVKEAEETLAKLFTKNKDGLMIRK